MGSDERQRAEIARLSAEVHDLARSLDAAQDDERKHLSQALHDGPQQYLASAVMMLDAALDALADDDPDELVRRITLARERTRHAIREMRELSFALEPPIKEEGLAASIRPIAMRVAEEHDVQFKLDLAAAERLDEDCQRMIFQIIQEAIANAVKHGRARRIAIRAYRAADYAMVVRVEDDGLGFAPEPAGDGLGRGTRTMRDRASALAGTIEWSRPRGGGTAVTLRVPAPGSRTTGVQAA